MAHINVMIRSAIVLLASVSIAFAQAGSTGGTIGKQGKSVSGGDDKPAAPHMAPTGKRASAIAATAPGTSPRVGCPNIVGVWNSWASGLFGKSDATFNSDGTSIHRSGIAGKWWCESGQLRMSWGGENPKTFRLSDDRRQIIEIATGAVGFSRN